MATTPDDDAKAKATRDADFRHAPVRDRPYKLADSGGLHLYVTPAGGRSWRYKYRFGGQERRIVFGAYPEVNLKRAREMRDDAKLALRQGRDPSLESKRARAVRARGHDDTFEKLARKWHDNEKASWSEVHAEDVLTSMEKDLFPTIGAHPVGEIDEPLLLSALRAVEKRGAIETAHRLRQRAERVFKFAAGEGHRNSNPAVNVAESLKPVPPSKMWPALEDVRDIRRLIRDSDRAAASPVTRLLSRFMALTAQRPGMPRNATWTHIEGVDWDRPEQPSPSALWRVPAAVVKQELKLRADDAFEHLVPLSQAAVDVLRIVRRLSGRRSLCFPGARDGSKPMSDNAVGYMYNREGWKGRHVPHGWRSSFSTIMNGRAERLYPGADRLVIDRLIIDLMLAHKPAGMSGSEFRYNRQRYMERRRELAEDWAALILEGADPVHTLMDGPHRQPS